MTIELGRTKTSEAEEGRAVKPVGRPVEAPTAGLESERITSGPVFLHISPAVINHMIKRSLVMAGYDETDYSDHGLRASYLTQADTDGVPLPEAMRQSKHRPVQRASNYYNHATAERHREGRPTE